MKNRVQNRSKPRRGTAAKRSRVGATTKRKQARNPEQRLESEWGLRITQGDSGLMPEDLKRAAREQELHVSAEGRRELKKHAS